MICACPPAGNETEAGVRAGHGSGQRGPRFALDLGAIETHHAAERLVGAQHDATLIQLHDAVDRGVEHQTEVLLGVDQRLVGLTHTIQGRVGFPKGGFLLVEGLGHATMRLRAGDLVRHDARRHTEDQQADDDRGLRAVHATFLVEGRHHGERGTSGDDGDAGEHGARPPSWCRRRAVGDVA